MDVPTKLHPSVQTIRTFKSGQLDEISAHVVKLHLEQCDDCRRHLGDLAADGFPNRASSTQGDAPAMSPFSQPARASKTAAHTGMIAAEPMPVATLPPGLANHPDYEIKRELGRGGMGVVYLAHNKMMGRDEVLKVMGRQIIDRPGVLDRFLREIRSVAKLRHPNIVTAYHATRLGDSIVFAMEYVAGLDLARTVKAKGALAIAQASNFIYQAALGLQHAHEEGLVHRDIKPGNLMLTRNRDKAAVKILDFGLAKASREEKVDLALTYEGQALGTPDFIAPEQILDAPSADIRADIYSLGSTFYFLLAGRPPFQANTLYDVYQAHLSREAHPLNLIRPEVPAELAALVAKMLAKDPSRRFQTPNEIAQALSPFFKQPQAFLARIAPSVSQGAQPAPDEASTRSDFSAAATPAGSASRSPVKSNESVSQQPALGQASILDGLVDVHNAGTFAEGARVKGYRADEGSPRRWFPVTAVGVLGLLGAIAWRAGIFSGLIAQVNLAFGPGPGAEPKAAHAVKSARVGEPASRAGASERLAAVEERTSRGKRTARIETKDSTSEPPPLPSEEPTRAKAADPPAVARALSGRDHPKFLANVGDRVLGFRQMVGQRGSAFDDTGFVRPSEAFWPPLAPKNVEGWQIGDPSQFKIEAKGVWLGAGPNGNLLLDLDDSTKRCTVRLKLSASAGTDAFVAIRANPSATEWRAVTVRLHEEGGKLRVGAPCLDFVDETATLKAVELALEKPAAFKFEIDEQNRVALSGAGKIKFSRSYTASDVASSGVAGIFLKSGTVFVYSLDVFRE